MTFDNDTFAYLAQFDDNFRTAVNSRWARHPGRDNMARMAEIYNAATGQNRRPNASCSSCVVNFLTDLGRLYFADKEERGKKAAGTAKKGKTKKES